MKTNWLFSLIVICTLAPSPSKAHRVPWNEMDPAFDLFRKDLRPDNAYQMAKLCSMIGKAPEQCVDELLYGTYHRPSMKRLNAFAECAKEIGEPDPSLERYMHKTEKAGTSDACKNGSGCQWHSSYIRDPRKNGYGDHKHILAKEQVEEIARQYAHEALRVYIRDFGNQTTTNSRHRGTETAGHITINAKTIIINGEAGLKHTLKLGSGQKTETMSPSLQKRQEKFQAAYNKAESKPWQYMDHDKVVPSILCEKGETSCTDFDSSVPYPNPDHPANQKPASPENNVPPSDSPQGNSDYYDPNNPDFPQSINPMNTKFAEPHDDPKKTLEQEMIACANGKLASERYHDYDEEYYRNTEIFTRCEMAQEDLEKHGTCDTRCFSKEYCFLFKNRNKINIDPAGTEPNEEERLKELKESIGKHNLEFDEPTDEEKRSQFCAHMKAWLESLGNKNKDGNNLPFNFPLGGNNKPFNNSSLSNNGLSSSFNFGGSTNLSHNFEFELHNNQPSFDLPNDNPGPHAFGNPPEEEDDDEEEEEDILMRQYRKMCEENQTVYSHN